MGTMKKEAGPGRKIINQMVKDSGLVEKIGYFPSAKYADGTPIAYVAQIQEYGVPEKNIPSRPFFRPTMDEKKSNWSKILVDGIKNRVVKGALEVKDVLEGVGMQAAGDIREKIAEIWTPPLKDSTVASRGRRAGMSPEDVSKKPLIDSGAMQAHLTHVTEQDNGQSGK